MSGVEREELARDNLQLDWQLYANCATVPADIMFPDKGNHSGARLARQVCANCDVIEPCLADALQNPPEHGYRGGKSTREITALRRDSAVTRAVGHEATMRANYETAAQMRHSGKSLAEIARRLGYASHGGVTALLQKYEQQEAAS